jgi:T5orf172 domain
MYPDNPSNPSAAASFGLPSLPVAEVSPPTSAVVEFPRHAQHSHIQRRPNRGPHGAPVTRQRALGPCSVYLLVHQHDRRFKIGLSQTPLIRVQHLPEAPCIDWRSSLQVVFPSQSRASQIERMLHKALADFRLDLAAVYRASWDGSTEWFAQSGFRHAINLLRVTPTAGDLSSLARMQPLDQALHPDRGNSKWQEAEHLNDSKDPFTLIQERHQQAVEHNRQQLAVIAEMLTVLSWSLRIDVQKSEERPTPLPAIVRIHGLKDDWSEAMMKARFEVLDSERWALHTGDAAPKPQVTPLVRLIRYSSTAPRALELVVNDLKVIGRLPGGHDVVAQWKALCQRLT